ncbi:hypothetical protein KO361_05090 [Candidatus Woesearchaeota archaeon]|nr:hypothetical protein [Candidatus Woesearchaeota archaeon]
MIDFIVGFILIWILVGLFGVIFWILYDAFLEEFLYDSENRKKLIIFFKVTGIITLLIVIAFEIWG